MEIVAMVCLLNRRIQRLPKLMYQRVLLELRLHDEDAGGCCHYRRAHHVIAAWDENDEG
jgi:hypothetical protein